MLSPLKLFHPPALCKNISSLCFGFCIDFDDLVAVFSRRSSDKNYSGLLKTGNKYSNLEITSETNAEKVKTSKLPLYCFTSWTIAKQFVQVLILL